MGRLLLTSVIAPTPSQQPTMDIALAKMNRINVARWLLEDAEAEADEVLVVEKGKTEGDVRSSLLLVLEHFGNGGCDLCGVGPEDECSMECESRV